MNTRCDNCKHEQYDAREDETRGEWDVIDSKGNVVEPGDGIDITAQRAAYLTGHAHASAQASALREALKAVLDAPRFFCDPGKCGKCAHCLASAALALATDAGRKP